MGKETDDWYFHGKEIIGSNDGGDSFKLGQANNDDMKQLLDQVQSFAWRLLSSLYRNWPTGRGVEGDRMRERLGEQIAAINQLFRHHRSAPEYGRPASFWSLLVPVLSRDRSKNERDSKPILHGIGFSQGLAGNANARRDYSR